MIFHSKPLSWPCKGLRSPEYVEVLPILWKVDLGISRGQVLFCRGRWEMIRWSRASPRQSKPARGEMRGPMGLIYINRCIHRFFQLDF